jgi:hypothetical protein
LENWKIAFPENTVVRFEYSGHNSPEEIGEEAIPFVKKFVDKN